MNIHAIKENERTIRIVRNIIRTYDGVVGTGNVFVIDLMARKIVSSLKRNKLMKTYRS